jgi:hypothetical protein
MSESWRMTQHHASTAEGGGHIKGYVTHTMPHKIATLVHNIVVGALRLGPPNHSGEAGEGEASSSLTGHCQ